MNELTIRKADSGDVRRIQELYAQLDRHHVESLPNIFQPIEEKARSNDLIQEWIDKDDADYLVTELGGQIVGFINHQQSAHPKYPMFQEHVFAAIENAIVDNAYRNKGIGTALFKAAIAWAKKRDLQYMQTTVWYANAGAREFYVKHGLRPLSQRLEIDLTAARSSAKA
jgi:ribosomal protein S18 acetylase RimI-like enzyme